MKTYTCINCNTEFSAVGSGRHKYCSASCKKEGFSKYKQQARVDQKAATIAENGIEGVDFVTCLICGERGKRLYGKHFNEKHAGLKKTEYQGMFPGAKVACDSDNEVLNRTRGNWMKTTEHKLRQSNAIKGSANPMSKKNSSDLKRQQASKFSIEYWKKRFPNDTLEELKAKRSIELKQFLSRRVVATSIQYYINLGFSEEEAKSQLSNRQTTFSLAKCIEKHGEEKGLEIWKARQEKWFTSYKKSNFSKISQKLFIEIFNKLDTSIQRLCRFAMFNPETLTIDNSGTNYELCLTLSKRVIKPDFIVEKKIIEFDGTYWHNANRVINTNKGREDSRDSVLSSNGYDVIHIKESDYINNPELVISDCLKFLTT